MAWRDFAYIETDYWARAVVTKRFKYITEYRPKAKEDFLPPGPDPNSIGREQLFDLEADPWETRNLASETAYSDVLSDCREKLFSFEAGLHRQPLRDAQTCRTLGLWAQRLRKRWADFGE